MMIDADIVLWQAARVTDELTREPRDPRISIEGPGDRDPEDNEDFEPGRDWSLACYQPELSELLGVHGNTLQTQRLVEAWLPADVNARLEWDSEGGMLWVCGSEADIRAVADVLQAKGRG